jgi:SulP family sulfate permease
MTGFRAGGLAFAHRARGAVASLRPTRATVRADAIAGIPGAIGSVPDGMASSVLVGVNPIHGLYASAVGPIVGGLFARTELMVVTTTTAAALAAGSALEGVAGDDRTESLLALTAIAGVLMVVAGVLRLGRYVRFVANSVMLGFLTGVAVNIVLGQLPDLLGAEAEGSPPIRKAADLLRNLDTVDWLSALVGVGALAILFLLSRTRLASVSTLVALAVPTLLTLGASSIVRVEDSGEIPRGLPTPHLPALGQLLDAEVLSGAFAVAVIVLVQGAGVAEAARAPGARPVDANGDFVAQGLANAACGVFRGQPVGGSVGQTALNAAAGAKTRWAAIFSGIWMLAILVAFSGVVGVVAMPTLAAILVYAAIGSLRLGEVDVALRTSRTTQIALVTTFLATLFLPMAAAVGVGVALSLLLQLNREAVDLRVVRLVPSGQGLREEAPPSSLQDRETLVLDVYGSLFYAGARTLQARLPAVAEAREPVVVLRLRGRTTLSSTAIAVIADYASSLAAHGGRLYLSGVDAAVLGQLVRSGRLAADGPLRVREATDVLGESTLRAVQDAEAWHLSALEADTGASDDRSVS